MYGGRKKLFTGKDLAKGLFKALTRKPVKTKSKTFKKMEKEGRLDLADKKALDKEFARQLAESKRDREGGKRKRKETEWNKLMSESLKARSNKLKSKNPEVRQEAFRQALQEAKTEYRK